MKKLFLVALVMLNFIGKAQDILNEENIGEFHNKQMEVFWSSIEKISKEKGNKNLTREDIISSFENLTLNVFGKESKHIKEYADTNFIIYSKFTIDENINESIKKIKDSNIKNNMLKEFLIELINDCKNLNNENYVEFFNIKKEYSKKNFKGEDLKIALIGINTGVSSYRYWRENMEKWDILVGNTNSTQARGIRGVATADVAGALVGACYGAVGGTAFLPGVGTVAGAVGVGCAGGLYASAVASIKGVLDWF